MANHRPEDKSASYLAPRDIGEVPERPLHKLEDDAAIVAEIAAHFIQWRTSAVVLTESRPFKWLQRIAALGRDNPDALWLYLQLQTGDASMLTQTYQAQADERGLDRQAVHQRHARAVEDMKLHFPELGRAIAEMDAMFRPPRGINKSV